MSKAIKHKGLTWLEAAKVKNITAEGGRIVVDPLLAEILQHLSIVGVTAYTDDFIPQIIAKTCPTPTERRSNRYADRDLPLQSDRRSKGIASCEIKRHLTGS